MSERYSLRFLLQTVACCANGWLRVVQGQAIDLNPKADGSTRNKECIDATYLGLLLMSLSQASTSSLVCET